MKIGLRVDVDTFRGTRYGVGNLCRLFREHGVKASFFFSVGPDNMGRHLWRLIRPIFLIKMFRSNAPSLYGWDIIFKGTLWPGPLIGKKLGNIIRSADKEGHEIGLHAWDHQQWQAHIDKMDESEIYESLKKGYDGLSEIIGRQPDCSAVPGWKCNESVIRLKDRFGFRYNSDCRGSEVFMPMAEGKDISAPQVPVTLPTYDEVIGRDGVSDKIYNKYMLSLLEKKKLNVLTIHAEVEGIARFRMFIDFLCEAIFRGWKFVPLGELVNEAENIQRCRFISSEIAGREGWVACQGQKINPAFNHIQA